MQLKINSHDFYALLHIFLLNYMYFGTFSLLTFKNTIYWFESQGLFLDKFKGLMESKLTGMELNQTVMESELTVVDFR